jgi:hypothetical protein
VEQGSQLRAPKRVEDGMRGPMGGRRPTLQGPQPTRIEGMDGIADGLIVATELLGNPSGPLTTGTGPQDLAAT